MAYVVTHQDRTTKPLFRATQVVWYILWVIEILLAFRFFLRLIGANPLAGFTNFIYTLSYPFAEPFRAVIGTTYVEGAVFEWTTLLAMVVYWILASAIVKLMLLGRPVDDEEARVRLSEEERY